MLGLSLLHKRQRPKVEILQVLTMSSYGGRFHLNRDEITRIMNTPGGLPWWSSSDYEMSEPSWSTEPLEITHFDKDNRIEGVITIKGKRRKFIGTFSTEHAPFYGGKELQCNYRWVD